MTNVIPLNRETNIDPDKVLKEAIGKLDCAVLIGYDREGHLYFASSKGALEDTNWLLDMGKREVLLLSDEEE